MSICTFLRPARTLDDALCERDRRAAALEQQARPKRVEIARRAQYWTEIPEARLVERGRVLVDSETDLVYVRRRGVVFERHSATIAYAAPNAALMTASITIKFAPLHTLERHNHPAWNRPGRTLYGPKLKFLPGRSTIPLLVDHDWERQVGTVDMLYRLDWLDGPWMCASATVTDPPAWLRRYDTKASFTFSALHRGSFTECEHIIEALVKEVSILSPGVEPAEPLAHVLSVRHADAPEPSPRVRVTSPGPGRGGEVFHDPPGTIIRRDGIGQVLGVR